MLIKNKLIMKRVICYGPTAIAVFNKMQSETRQTSPPVPPPGDLDQTTMSDVRLVSPTRELEETYEHRFRPTPCNPALYENMTKIKKTNLLHSQATVTDIMHRKFVKIWTCDFWDLQADRQKNKQTSDRQTDRHTHHNTSHLYWKQSKKSLSPELIWIRFAWILQNTSNHHTSENITQSPQNRSSQDLRS